MNHADAQQFLSMKKTWPDIYVYQEKLSYNENKEKKIKQKICQDRHIGYWIRVREDERKNFVQSRIIFI